jgi:hypothetical protein
MSIDRAEFETRRRKALAAIDRAAGTPDGEDSIDLFIAHHLEELPPSYWQQLLGSAKPSAATVLGLLVLRKPWGEDDLENFDFTLPGDVTNYVVSVHFDAAGEADRLDMES